MLVFVYIHTEQLLWGYTDLFQSDFVYLFLVLGVLCPERSVTV